MLADVAPEIAGPFAILSLYPDGADHPRRWELELDGIDWLIAGGESGPGHRPLNLNHARELRDACAEAGVAFFFKQVGGPTPKSGGKLLDGVEYCEFPVSA